jgi:hypothetical protein
MVVCALVPLALGIAGDLYVVAAKVLGSTSVAILLAATSLVFFYGLWVGLMFGLRSRVGALPRSGVTSAR